jgi:hypothetical protein
MQLDLQILPSDLLAQYCTEVADSLSSAFEALEDSELSADTFSFYISVSAVFSSKIADTTVFGGK